MTTVANPPYSEFGISEFISRVGAKGYFAKRNRYTVEITPPSGLLSDPNITDTPDPANIQFLIKAVSLPARTSGTSTFRYGGKYAMDLPYEIPPTEATLSFTETNDHKCRKFWYNWMEYIMSVDSYNLKYFDTFKGTIKISTFDETQDGTEQPNHKVVLEDVYPSSIEQISLGWALAELADFQVNLKFTRWKIEI